MATNYQTGGWYDNPATGTNMRWFPSGWTTGADPGVGSSGSTSSSSSGGGSSGGGSEDYMTIAKNFADAIAANVKKVTPYGDVNPFSFDEALATESATKEYSPYYARLLTDYTQNVERTKSRSAEDLKTTLDQLSAGKEYYTGVQRRALDTATRNTNEGYAGNGLFFSGVRERDIKQLQTENTALVGNYMNTYKYNTGQAETGNQRTIENQDVALSQYSRDTGEAQKAAIAGQVQTQKTEALNEYGLKQKDYYANEFGSYYA